MSQPSLDQHLKPGYIGVGARHPHFDDFAAGRVDVDWVEVHSETFFCEGGQRLSVLERICSHYPVSFHGVNLSLGSSERPSKLHIDQLKKMIKDFNPFLISEHLSWGKIDQIYMNDLLPLPLTKESLENFVTNTDILQQALGQKILLENPSTYLRFTHQEMTEWEFLSQIVLKTGCGLLLDLNNIYVSACNHNLDALDWIDAFDSEWVGEYHLAGHRVEKGANHLIRIDDHASPVIDPVWDLFFKALSKYGKRHAMIEWDLNVPALPVLMKEVEKMRAFFETDKMQTDTHKNQRTATSKTKTRDNHKVA
ncbi:MAG: DUF692 domain-containing protein [Pseudomonadota bacterium]